MSQLTIQYFHFNTNSHVSSGGCGALHLFTRIPLYFFFLRKTLRMYLHLYKMYMYTCTYITVYSLCGVTNVDEYTSANCVSTTLQDGRRDKGNLRKPHWLQLRPKGENLFSLHLLCSLLVYHADNLISALGLLHHQHNIRCFNEIGLQLFISKLFGYTHTHTHTHTHIHTHADKLAI